MQKQGRQTDRPTDRWTDGRTDIILPSNLGPGNRVYPPYITTRLTVNVRTSRLPFRLNLSAIRLSRAGIV